jgi:hypothetical protein
LLGALLLLLSEAQAQTTGVQLSCAAASPPRTIGVPLDGTGLRLHIVTGSSWLEIEELGQRVTVAAATTDLITIPQPLRYGWHWLQANAGETIVVQRREPQDHAATKIRATMHCSPSADLEARIAWLRRASELGATLDSPSGAEQLARSLTAIRKLDEDAANPLQHAIALHFSAELFGANSRAREAIDAFETAERAWLALRDHERALAAHLGRIEELHASDAHQAVLDGTPDPASLHGPQSYFATRLENPRCLTLQLLGRLDEAAACFDWLLAHYRTLDEGADYIAAAQNYAGLLRDRGDLKGAQKIGERSLELASGPYAPMLRGRLRLMLADLAMRRGQVARAFSDAELALGEFDQGQFDAALWQASTLTFTAALYSQVGANEEALGALGDAVRILSPLNAPGRMAAAMNIYADIETNLQRNDTALFWRHAAEQTYQRLALLPAWRSTRAKRLGLQIRLGDFADVAREVADIPATDPLYRTQRLLLGAELALHDARLEDALSALDQASRLPLSLRDQIRLTLLKARHGYLAGERTSMQQALSAGARHVDTLARRAGNPTLAYVIARQSLRLRDEAFRVALEQPAAEQTVETVWEWLAISASAASVAAGSADESAEPFDRAVAAELLSPIERAKPVTDMAAQRELLTLLAQPKKSAPQAPAHEAADLLADFRQALDEDSAFVAFIDGGERGALLWVTHDAARIVATAAPDLLRASAAALREQVHSASAPVAEIRAAAHQLSTQLFGAITAGPPPHRLFVLADEPAIGIPWSVLPWPGQTEPLVDSTAVSLVHLARAADASAATTPRALRVFVAAQSLGDPDQLRPLAGASVEAGQIHDALGDALRIEENTQATRRSVLNSLEQSGAWLHIAAHGSALPQRIGYAGIWLEPPAPGATPAFLSWLDVLDNGVRADLVVLDACQLGDSGTAIGGNLSFADAMSRAGARRVIAALWPVSDAASALWVPAFYRALLADPAHDAAQALRNAQLRLRASRAFTHPFFWASLQSIERLDLPASHRVHRR